MAKSEEVVLLSFWASPFCIRVKIALNEKGVDFIEKEETNLLGGKSELLLKSNPIHQKVPVLLHHGQPICESTVIVDYVNQAWPSLPPLLPSSPYEVAQARFWADFIDKKVYDSGSRIWQSKGEELEAAVKDFVEILKQLEKSGLAENDFFGGETFGLVDILLLGLTSWFYAYEEFGGFKVEHKCPKLSAWIKRCMQRDSVSKAFPEPQKIYDFVGMLRKMNGIE